MTWGAHSPAVDPASDTWKEIVKQVSARIEKSRDELESDNHSELEYARFRGEIRALRALLRLGNRPPTGAHQGFKL
jgi:hypothetical protein